MTDSQRILIEQCRATEQGASEELEIFALDGSTIHSLGIRDSSTSVRVQMKPPADLVCQGKGHHVRGILIEYCPGPDTYNIYFTGPPGTEAPKGDRIALGSCAVLWTDQYVEDLERAIRWVVTGEMRY